MTGQLLFFAALVPWVGFDVYLFFGRPRSGVPAERASKWVMLAFILVGLLGGMALSADARAAWLLPFGPLRLLGVVLVIAGALARMALVRWFGTGFTVEVAAPRKLFTTGPYRLVRHPAYAAELVAFAGVALAYEHAFASSLAFVLPTVGVLWRVRVEERMLREALGAAWTAYAARTKRFVPWVF